MLEHAQVPEPVTLTVMRPADLPGSAVPISF
jgi:hypothetical protein